MSKGYTNLAVHFSAGGIYGTRCPLSQQFGIPTNGLGIHLPSVTEVIVLVPCSYSLRNRWPDSRLARSGLNSTIGGSLVVVVQVCTVLAPCHRRTETDEWSPGLRVVLSFSLRNKDSHDTKPYCAVSFFPCGC